MNETILLYTMIGLAIIEIGLIFSIYKLTKILKSISKEIREFQYYVVKMGDNVQNLYNNFKNISVGKIKVTGKTPMGDINLDLNAKKE